MIKRDQAYNNKGLLVMSFGANSRKSVVFDEGISAEAEDIVCATLNESADRLKEVAEMSVSTLAERIEVHNVLGALITKLQRIKTELVSESPLHGIVGSMVGGNRNLPGNVKGI